MTARDKKSRSAWSVGRDGDLALRRDESPVLLLGGQVHNSSSSSPASIADSFAHVRAINGNAVLSPVSWALTEPEEGSFDFSLVDNMLEAARSNDLRLVLLWYGAYKNARSTYAPSWVRGNPERFPRTVINAKGRSAFSYEGSMPGPVVTVFSESLREADACAFESLLRHLAEVDTDDVVALIQVQNETGMLRDSRDRGPLAEVAWHAQVPAALLAFVRDEAQDASLVRTLWKKQGEKQAGTWGDVFGTDSGADEVFMAWSVAQYIEHLAVRGQAIKNVPMYANAWLGPQPGQDEPGQYPSGGPGARVLDVWKVAAPSLALLGPDIYIDDADGAMRTYATGTQPLFVPESRLSAGELVRAIGTYRAIGWSAFGVDGANPEGQLAATLEFLTALESVITTAQPRDRVSAVVVEPGQEVVEVRVGEIDIAARGTFALFQRMLLDAGIQIPDRDHLSLPNETLPTEPVPYAGEERPFGLLVVEDENSIIIVGQGLTLDFFHTGSRVEIDSVEELLVQDGRIVSGRVLNGDERLRVVPTAKVGAARIRLLRLSPEA